MLKTGSIIDDILEIIGKFHEQIDCLRRNEDLKIVF